MGADFFDIQIDSVDDDPSIAFDVARREATEYYGTRSYTGSIKEKTRFNLITCRLGHDAADAKVNSIVDNYNDNFEDPFGVMDKWGPCGCIRIKKGCFRFFGMASS
jgi:hypothetical protein